MASHCKHMAGIRDVTPSALGCEECLKTGDEWAHLRICGPAVMSMSTKSCSICPIGCPPHDGPIPRYYCFGVG